MLRCRCKWLECLPTRTWPRRTRWPTCPADFTRTCGTPSTTPPSTTIASDCSTCPSQTSVLDTYIRLPSRRQYPPNRIIFASRKNRRKKLRLSRKTAEIYFSAIRCKNFSLNLHYEEIIFDSPGITLLNRQVIKCLNRKKWKWKTDVKIITKSLRNKNESLYFYNVKTGTKHYFKPYICLPDTFLAEKLYLHAFTASRKTSHKFSQESRFDQKIRIGGLTDILYYILYIDHYTTNTVNHGMHDKTINLSNNSTKLNIFSG